MESSLFGFRDYKKFLRNYIQEATPRRGIISRMAAAAQCQQSYLSQVLNSHVQLTPDQALALGEFSDLTNLELEYFILLVDHARAGSPKLKARIENKLDSIKRDSENLSERLQRPKIEVTESQAIYYSSWIWSALHILTDIPAFQNVDALSKALHLNSEATLSYLKKLEEVGFVKRDQGNWKYSGREIHLPKDSPFISMHHLNWRQVAVLNSQKHRNSDLHFTGVYAVSRHDKEKMKEIILKILSELGKTASASPPETLICLNQDFFEVQN